MTIEQAIDLIKHSANHPGNDFPAQYRAGMLNAAALVAFYSRHASDESVLKRLGAAEQDAQSVLKLKAVEQEQGYPPQAKQFMDALKEEAA